MKVELSSRNTFIYLPRIFYGILYFIYKGGKLRLTSRRKPPLAPLSEGFIAKVQFIVEIIPRRTHGTHGDWQLHFSGPSDRETSLRPPPSSPLSYSRNVSFVAFTLSVRSRGSVRSVICYRHRDACVTSICEMDQGSSGTVEERKKKKCRRAKGGNVERGINCTGDADLFERDTLPWYVMRLGVNRRARDTFERRCHFRSTDNAYSRDLTSESAAAAAVAVAV